MRRSSIRFALLTVSLALTSCSPNRTSGVLTYQMREEADSSGQCDSARTLCISVGFTYPEFTDQVPVALRDSLQRYVQAEVFASLGNGGVSVPFDTITARLFDEYRELKEEFTSYAIPWRLRRKLEVIADTLGVVSLRFEEESFLGGAHGMDIVRLASFDAETGKRLMLADVFAQGSDSALARVLEAELRKARSLPDSESLEDAGFWIREGKFPLTGNFAVEPGRVLFYYNTYEIAPYASGPTLLDIPVSALTPLLERRGVLRTYVQ
jgi:hypothetical protein